MDRINIIRLDDVEPRVFVDESEPDHRRPSGIWRSKVSFERGKLYCINAASGTGKTSLCSFVTGVRTDYVGHIYFDDSDISAIGMERWCALRRSHLAYMPQELEVFGSLSALDNVLLKNRLTDYRSEAEIRHMFEYLEIDNRIDTQAGRMSVGQRQRVAVIRTLCQPADFILLDEPVSHLDPVNNARCGRLIADEAARQGAGVIFTSVGAILDINRPYIPLSL